MDKHELLERYEVRGEDRDFVAAKPLYEQALAEAPSAQLLLDYGYLLECHGRRELRQAAEQYRRALELDPNADKGHYQLIHALAALFDTEEMIALYERRVAAAPADVREYRFLASAYVAAPRLRPGPEGDRGWARARSRRPSADREPGRGEGRDRRIWRRACRLASRARARQQ